jgi:predicted transposase/invertase (TIGR01784 family)
MYQLLYTREIAGFFIYLGSRISKATMAALEKALKGIQQQHLLISYADEIKAEGIAQGKAEGIAQGKAEIVLHMYSKGLKADEIATLTGISTDAISNIIEAKSCK